MFHSEADDTVSLIPCCGVAGQSKDIESSSLLCNDSAVRLKDHTRLAYRGMVFETVKTQADRGPFLAPASSPPFIHHVFYISSFIFSMFSHAQFLISVLPAVSCVLGAPYAKRQDTNPCEGLGSGSYTGLTIVRLDAFTLVVMTATHMMLVYLFRQVRPPWWV